MDREKTVVYSVRECQKKKKREGKGLLCSTSAVNVQIKWLKFFAGLCMSTDDRESNMNIDLGVTTKF